MVEWIVRIVLVVGLLALSALLATPRGRLPLALRGLRRMLRRDAGLPEKEKRDGEEVPTFRKILAFVLVLVAVLIACLTEWR